MMTRQHSHLLSNGKGSLVGFGVLVLLGRFVTHSVTLLLFSLVACISTIAVVLVELLLEVVVAMEVLKLWLYVNDNHLVAI